MPLQLMEVAKMPTLSHDPTYLGTVAFVSGASISVDLAQSIASGMSVIDGRIYKVGQVGSFVRIPQGYQDLFGIVAEVSAKAPPLTTNQEQEEEDTGRSMVIQLIGESIGNVFERGISQYPNIGDSVHITTEDELDKIYGISDTGHVKIGALSSAESIPAQLSLSKLVTRHSAILGSTGSGKSTTVASLLRSITSSSDNTKPYPNSRILMLDIHGEYSTALDDVATVYSVDSECEKRRLQIPYWALNSSDLLAFLTGGVDGPHEVAFTDKIFQLKVESNDANQFLGVESITADTPLPFSLEKLWYDLNEFEIQTLEGPDRDQPAKTSEGDAETLTASQYKPHSMGNKGPFLNQEAVGIGRQLNLLRSRLLDKRYNFLLHPVSWKPGLDGRIEQDLDVLLEGWIGGEKPITILDLSGIPSLVLERLVGSILKIVYESLFWSREKSEGGIQRPLLIVMEEAHRYLSNTTNNLAVETVKKIAKEGRKYGVGAMIISQRPSEVDETILSQCGTFFALRLSNPSDQARVKGTLPENLLWLLDVLPVLRTGEAIVMGEAAKLPMRCQITLPPKEHQPQSTDPEVTEQWSSEQGEEDYRRVVASWRSQNPKFVEDLESEQQTETDYPVNN